MLKNAVLEARSLNVHFGGLHALRDVSFALGKGQIVGLIGPNGAGKTTLFSALMGVVSLRSGSVVLDGIDTRGYRPHRIARMGMTKTFQNTALFPDMSLRENVLTAALVHSDLADARALAEECLDTVGLRKVGGEDVGDLTFPQRALGEVARALATRPHVLLLDEVMAALTPREMDEVIFTLKRLRDMRGISMLVVEHHMRAIMRFCDRILVLNFGQLIADDEPRRIGRNEEVIKAYLGAAYADAA